MIRLKRVYEPAAKSDGKRMLVERLWPRGVKKEALQLDGWLRDVAPSTELRKWFDHRPERWSEFQKRYRAELDASREAWQPLLDLARKGTVTLLFSSQNTTQNNAVVLSNYIKSKLR